MNCPEGSLEFFQREAQIFEGKGKSQVISLASVDLRRTDSDLFEATAGMLGDSSDIGIRAGFFFAHETEKRYPFDKRQFAGDLSMYRDTCGSEKFRAGIDIYLVAASAQSIQTQISSPLLRAIG